jgi:hypothetical protein
VLGEGPRVVAGIRHFHLLEFFPDWQSESYPPYIAGWADANRDTVSRFLSRYMSRFPTRPLALPPPLVLGSEFWVLG